MISDRRTSRLLNSVCGVFALSTVGAIGYMAHVDRKASEGVQPWRLPAHAGVRDLASAAVRALYRGDDKEAERRYREALALRPSNEGLQWGLAQALIGQGKRKEAWEVYRKLVDADPPGGKWFVGSGDARAWYADLALEFGSPEQARRAIRRSVFSPKSAVGLKRELSWAHLWADTPPPNRYGRLHHAERAVQLDSTLISARLGLADALHTVGKEAESQRQVEEALRLASKGPSTDWLTVADYYQRHRMPAERKRAEEEARRRIPRSDARGWLALYNFTRFSGIWPASRVEADAGALRAAQSAVRPDDGRTLVELAGIFGSEPPDARLEEVYIERALRVVKPNQVDLYERLASLVEGVGRKSESLTMLKEALPYADAFRRRYLQARIDRLEGRSRQPFSLGGGTGGGMLPYGYQYATGD